MHVCMNSKVKLSKAILKRSIMIICNSNIILIFPLIKIDRPFWRALVFLPILDEEKKIITRMNVKS